MLSYMSPEQACELAVNTIGGPTEVGKLFSPAITSQAVSQWKVIPLKRAKVVVWKARQLGADITIEQACPDLAEVGLPGTAVEAGAE